MAKGEVPVAYIIALILGIAVVAVLGYWFFVVHGQSIGEMNYNQCTNKAYTYCSIWRSNDYAEDNDAPDLGFFYGGAKWFSAADVDAGIGAYAPIACTQFDILSVQDTTTLRAECESLLGG